MTKREVSGIIITLFGVALTITSLFSLYFFLIYGIPLILIGLYILFNKKEDQIEGINYKKGGKTKRKNKK